MATSYVSPLDIKGFVQQGVRPLPSLEVNKSREATFVNDAIKTVKYNIPRKIPIIPVFDPYTDPWSQRYFESPLVQGVVDVTLRGKVSQYTNE